MVRDARRITRLTNKLRRSSTRALYGSHDVSCDRESYYLPERERDRAKGCPSVVFATISQWSPDLR